jgi:hypothetical protein
MSMPDDATPDALDALIEKTARSMTAGAPSAALRVAVRSAIAPVTRRPAPQRWRLAGAVASLAIVGVIAGALLLDITGGPAAPPRNVEATATTRAPGSDSTTRVPAPQELAPPDRRPVLSAGPAATAAGAALPVSAASESPLSPEEFVVVEPLPAEAVDDTPVELELMETPMPLRAEWVEIEPLFFQ